jgi:hypothetical protein
MLNNAQDYDTQYNNTQHNETKHDVDSCYAEYRLCRVPRMVSGTMGIKTLSLMTFNAYDKCL